MADKCMSDSCDHPLLREGDLIVQMGKGTFCFGHPTPAGREISGEWHRDCFKEYDLKPQTLPYRCVNCKEDIEDQAPVLFAFVGKKPDEPYTTPKLRGEVIHWITHVRNCGQK